MGHPHCSNCGRPITAQTAEQIIDQVMTLDEGTRFMVEAPVIRGRKGEYGKLFEELRGEGYTRVKVDGELRRLEEDIALDKKFKHDISVVVDRLVMRPDLRRPARRLDRDRGGARRRARGRRDGRQRRDPHLLRALRLPALRHLDAGARAADVLLQLPPRRVPALHGLGSHMEIDPELIVPDPSLSLNEGAILPWSTSASNYYDQMTTAIAERYEIDMDTPWEELPEDAQDTFLFGTDGDRVISTATATAASARHHLVRGDRAQPRAPLQGDRVRARPGEDRGVHDRCARARPAAAPACGRSRWP